MTAIDFFYPFDSVNSDRKTTAATERRFFNALYSTGVVGSGGFPITETSAGAYTIGAGTAIIGGAIGGILNPKSVAARPAQGATLYIVLRLDTTSAVRRISLEVVSNLQSATQEQLDNGGQLDLPLYSVNGQGGGTYGLLDHRTYCTSFDAEPYKSMFEQMTGDLIDMANETFSSMYEGIMAMFDEVDAGLSGALGSQGRQGFINPAFLVNQRGQDSYQLTSGTTYTFDRWLARIGGASTTSAIDISREEDTDTKRSVLRVQNKAYAAGTTPAASCIAQNIEGGVHTFLNRGFTLSFDARATSACTIAVEPVAYEKAGGAGVAQMVRTVNLTTNWQPFIITFDANSGVLGNGVDDVLKIGFFFAWRNYAERFGADQDKAVTIRFANMQINQGREVLPCYIRDFGDELERCKRYYNVMGFTSLSCGAQNATTRQIITSPLPLTRTMRTQPTVTVTDRANVQGAASIETVAGAWRNGLACTTSANSADWPVFIVTNTDSAAATRVCFNSVTLNAELMD